MLIRVRSSLLEWGRPKETFKINEKLKEANIITKDLKFLYCSEEHNYFFDNDTSEYYEIENKKVFFNKKWIKEGTICTAIFWNNEIISIKPPKFVELKVINTDDIKKDLGTHKNFKQAETETNAFVKVPIFIKEHDTIKIDTEENTYISRVNT